MKININKLKLFSIFYYYILKISILGKEYFFNFSICKFFHLLLALTYNYAKIDLKQIIFFFKTLDSVNLNTCGGMFSLDTLVSIILEIYHTKTTSREY